MHLYHAQGTLAIALGLCFGWCAAQAEIKPEEVAILANKSSRESLAVAAYYAKARQIPTAQICQIPFPEGETLSRDDWESRIRPAIRAWVNQRQLETRLRLFVTVWDVPLKIDRKKPPSATVRLQQRYLEREQERHRSQLEGLVQQLEQVAASGQPESKGEQALGEADQGTADARAQAADNTTRPAAAIKKSKAEQFSDAFERARQRVGGMPNKPAKEQALKQLRNVFVRAAGLTGIAQNLAQNPEAQSSAQVRSEFDVTRGALQGLQQGRLALEATPMDVRRDAQGLSLVLQMGGEINALEWLESQLDAIRKNETNASLDSELSLLLWPDYDLLRWQPNYLHYSFDNSLLPEIYRTLMVGRVEAPTLALTKGIIDTALAVEQKGLTGKIYLDARGIGKLDNTPVQPDSYADYDRAILMAQAILKEHGHLPVVLNSEPKLFQPGECPDAAVYCGWYSLGKYVDAFEWVPGSIGYHIASSEATTLRAAESQVWCKRMLEDGICATFGPVYEPYLTPFPKPNEFLPVLLSGQYTIAESYYRTTRCRSWMMTLVGDPLYNPFRKQPAVNVDSLPGPFQQLIEGFSSTVPAR